MKKTAINLAIIIVVLCTGAGLYRYRETHRGPVDYSSLNGAERAKALGRQVGKLVLLPEGAVPSVATVTDISLLKDRPLFANARNGDAILVYSTERRVILYRESVGKVVDIGPVTVDAGQPAEPPVGALTGAIYNGSKIPELAAPVRDLVKTTFPSVYFIQERNAANSYGKNIVVDITGKQDSLVRQIAAAIGGDVSVLPPGEDKPGTDILIIIGK